MPTRSGWSHIDNADQHFGDSGQHTLVTFPKSQKSITIEWHKSTVGTIAIRNDL